MTKADERALRIINAMVVAGAGRLPGHVALALAQALIKRGDL